jgi:hypothetical protein
MPGRVAAGYLDSKTPADAIVAGVGGTRIMDPTLGTPGVNGRRIVRYRQHSVSQVVTIGDSLIHGMSTWETLRVTVAPRCI